MPEDLLDRLGVEIRLDGALLRGEALGRSNEVLVGAAPLGPHRRRFVAGQRRNDQSNHQRYE